MTKESGENRLFELAKLFFKLGVIGFGGPAAHIAMMEDEVVKKRGWMTIEHFLDLVGATNLIPGPNSTEMTMHTGYHRAGFLGMIVAGTCFILPAAFLTGLVAWFYVEYGALPEVAPFLAGIKPAVLAVIFGALWKLGKKAIKSIQLGIIGLFVVGLLYAGLTETVALLIGGILGMLWLIAGSKKEEEDSKSGFGVFVLPFKNWLQVAGIGTGTGLGVATVSVWKLGLFFLKVGAVLYGSGYVLIAFLQGELVDQLGWLTQQQLLDAIAMGQFTPGPVLTTATFIGYLLGGVKGAVISTLAIFLPSFLFVSILNPLVPKLRKSKWASAFLDAVNASAMALMLMVTVQLSISTLIDLPSIVIFALSAVLLIRFKVSVVWLVAGGAFLGWILGYV